MYLFSLYIGHTTGCYQVEKTHSFISRGKLHINIKGKNGQLVVSWCVTRPFDTSVADKGDP